MFGLSVETDSFSYTVEVLIDLIDKWTNGLPGGKVEILFHCRISLEKDLNNSCRIYLNVDHDRFPLTRTKGKTEEKCKAVGLFFFFNEMKLKFVYTLVGSYPRYSG